ncbi:AraC family transcriptional regulator [soil metagenome]
MAPAATSTPSHTLSPQAWGRALPFPPVLASDEHGWRTSVLRRWRGSAPVMSQPPLDHHYVVLHLGGPKSVERTGPDGVARFAVAEGSLTIVPAGTAFEWNTQGPIDFAHLYVSPARFDRAVATVFDREPSAVRLEAGVGVVDPLLAELIRAMLGEVDRHSPWRSPYLDALFDAAVIHLAGRHSTIRQVEKLSRHSLAPSRLKRVLEHVDTTLDAPLTLSDLATVAGLSRFHFSRAFRSAVGETPLAYVARKRVERARALLRKTELPLAEVARQAGFTSPGYFSTAFKRSTGLKPSLYRQQL